MTTETPPDTAGSSSGVAADAEQLLAEAGFPSDLRIHPLKRSRPRRHVWNSALPLLLGLDVVTLGAAVVGGLALDRLAEGQGVPGRVFAASAYIVVFVAVTALYGLYRRGRRRLVGSSFPDFSHLVHSLIIGSLLVLLLTGPLHRGIGLPQIPVGAAAFTILLGVVAVPAGRAIGRIAVQASGRGRSRVLVVGSGLVASRVVQRLERVNGIEVVGCVDDNAHTGGEPWEELPLIGGLDDLPGLIADKDVNHVVVAFSPATGAKLAGLLRSLAGDVQISVVPRLFDLLTVRSNVDDLHGLPVVDVAAASLGPAARLAKRAMDLAASTLGLIILSPLFAIMAVAIRLTSPGGVFFRQRRAGRAGRVFFIFKFRTMRVGAEGERTTLTSEIDGPLFKVRDDPRVTRIGAFLRKTSIDELPQLINVFKGDMSLVGPRPFVISESSEIAGWAARRFDVRPGITGLWQISGRNDLPFDELCRLDYSYVASWSLWWDLRILWHTPAMVLRRHGAY
ncbi:MAG TPA: sugar transferase [Acidimicrobiales bacterium]